MSATDIGLDRATTLAVACMVLILGQALVKRIEFLRKYSIPEPVVGGLLAAIAMTLLHAAGTNVVFNTEMQPGLMLAFFASIGLGADIRMLIRGGGKLLLFTACVTGMLLMQNLIGVGAAMAMGIDPLIGLIAGSITMAGGHGTGAAWGARFSELYGMAHAPSLALAAATFGLILGGLVGGPLAMRLIRRLQARGSPLCESDSSGYTHDAAEAEGPFTPMRLIIVIGLIAISIAAGQKLSAWTENPTFTLPTFVWVLFVGAVLRNALAFARVHEVDNKALYFAGEISLAIFLGMALMSLRLWELASIALPLIVILALQVVGVALFVSFITFRVMGRNYEAAVLVTGQAGIGLGATATAIANIQAVCSRYGMAPLAFIIVPVVGAFLIDLANAVVISLFELGITKFR